MGGGLASAQEYARARAAAEGMPGVGVVTVSERPTRLAVTAGVLVAAAAARLAAPALVAVAAVAGAVGWAALGAAGLAQFLVAARRAL